MKNVAKCDTWCELQNPVNHRVFERKLRPKPLGRGHACLGVSHRVAPYPVPAKGSWDEGADFGPPCALVRGRPKYKSRSTNVTTSGGCDTVASCRARLDPRDCFVLDPKASFLLSLGRDPRSGGITR